MTEIPAHLMAEAQNFDETWYRRFYRDVDEAIKRGEYTSGLEHFIQHGVREGRFPGKKDKTHYLRFYGKGENRFSKLLQNFLEQSEHSAEKLTELCEIMGQEGSDKGIGLHNWHNYTLLYDLMFAQLRHQVLNVFELGIGTNYSDVAHNMGPTGRPGASLRGWRRYFPYANVVGADVDKRILFSEPRISTFYVDQLREDTIQDLWSNFSNIAFDIVIDDGLHSFEANSMFMAKSLHKVAPNGFYVVEDIATQQHNLEKFDAFFSEIGALDGFMVSIPHQENVLDNCIAFFQPSADWAAPNLPT